MKKICFHPIFLAGCAVVVMCVVLVFGRRAEADIISVTAIRVIDFDTRAPISGAVIKTLCTGLINPTSTNFISMHRALRGSGIMNLQPSFLQWSRSPVMRSEVRRFRNRWRRWF